MMSTDMSHLQHIGWGHHCCQMGLPSKPSRNSLATCLADVCRLRGFSLAFSARVRLCDLLTCIQALISDWQSACPSMTCVCETEMR